MDFYAWVCKHDRTVWFPLTCWSKITAFRFINILRWRAFRSAERTGWGGSSERGTLGKQKMDEQKQAETLKQRKKHFFLEGGLFVDFLPKVLTDSTLLLFPRPIGNKSRDSPRNWTTFHQRVSCPLMLRVEEHAPVFFIYLFIYFTNAWTIVYCI